MLFVVTLVKRWSKLEFEGAPFVRVQPPKQIGYLPVFEVYEDALEYAGGNASLVTQIQASTAELRQLR